MLLDILDKNLIIGNTAPYIFISRRKVVAAGTIPSVISRGSIEISRRLIDAYGTRRAAYVFIYSSGCI